MEKITAAMERMDAARTNHRKRYTKRPQAANISTYPSDFDKTPRTTKQMPPRRGEAYSV
jgi:hypothetical protein